MRVTILGCGGAGGVPMIGHGWGKCDPTNPRNRRRRSSILVEEGDTAILVDTSPDLRQQALDAGIRRLDAVLYTHTHADHLHGIDDLREINRAMAAPLPVYAEKPFLDQITHRFSYVFGTLEEGVPIYKPMLLPRAIKGPFEVDSVNVTPFPQNHGYGPSTGFRFGPVAYSTDVIDLPEEAFAVLEGVRLWIVGCLTMQTHTTHAHLDKALAWIDRVRPERAVLTHMGPGMDYETVQRATPPHVEPAYDGMVLEA